MIDLDSDIQKLIGQTKFMVEASSMEIHSLWKEYVMYQKILKDDEWRFHGGRLITIDYWGDRPINLVLSWYNIKGFLICFYECSSELCDWKVVDRWLNKYFPNKDEITDAVNFPIGYLE